MTFPRNQILALLLIVSLFQNNSLVHAAASFLNHSNANVNVNANINAPHSRPLNRIGDGIQSLLPLGISSSKFLRLGGGRRKHKHNHHGHNGALFAMGDLISGITGQAPKSLEPPLEELLKDTNLDPELSRVDLQCVYKASRDGWSAIDFHECCDGRGSALVVALSKSGKKFGGFNPLGWQSTDDYGSTNSAFLWYTKGGVGGSSGSAGSIEKCPVLSGGNAAIFDYATGGPQFGSADLIIGPPKAAIMGGFAGPDMEDSSINAGSLRQGRSSVGGAYDMVGRWPMGGTFSLVEVEIYVNGSIGQIKGNGGGVFGGFKWPF